MSSAGIGSLGGGGLSVDGRAAVEDGLPTIQTFQFSAASAYTSNDTWTDPASGLTLEWKRQGRSTGSLTVLDWELLISGSTFGLPDGVHDPMIFEWAFTPEYVLVNPGAVRVDAVGVDSNASAAAAIRAAVNGVGAGLALTAGAVVDATVPFANDALGAYNAGITIGAAEGAMSKVDMAGGTVWTATPDMVTVDISEATDAQSVAVAHRAVYNAEAGAVFTAAVPVAGLTTFTAKLIGPMNDLLFGGTGAGTATITQLGSNPLAAGKADRGPDGLVPPTQLPAALTALTPVSAELVAVGGAVTLAGTDVASLSLGGAAASPNASLAILGSKTVATVAANTVWRGLDFQASTLTLTAGGVAPSELAGVHIAAPVITQTAGGTYTVAAAATVTIAGPPTSGAGGGATPTLTNAASLIVESGNVGFGTKAPAGALHVYRSAGTWCSIAESSEAELYNEFKSSAGYAEYGIAGSSLYFKSTSLTGGIVLYGNASASIGLHVSGANNVGIGVTPIASSKLHVLASTTVTSAAGAVYDGVKLAASALSITGNTQITTATGVNFHKIEAPTINCDTAGLTIDHSATLFVSGAPIVGTNAPTLSDNLAVWIAAGNVKIGSLAGTGTRNVVVDANGVLSAP